MRVKVWGGAGEYGRSCYFIENKAETLLFDCGIHRSCTDCYPKIEKEPIPFLQAVFISHIHEDHTMGLPLLAKYGYKKKIWITSYTLQQLPLYFEKWKSYNKEKGEDLPYNQYDIENLDYICIDQMSHPNEWIDVTSSLRFQWGYSGHVLGAVWFLVDMNGAYVFYSGDYTPESCLLRADLPTNLKKSIKLAILDAGYHTDCTSQKERIFQLFDEIDETLRKNGTVLLPVPPLGRAQDLLMLLQKRYHEIPILVDSEIKNGLEKMKQYTEWLKENVFPKKDIDVRNIFLINGRITLQKNNCAQIILIRDANMQTDDAKNLYKQLKTDNRNTIIFTGNVAKGSFAEKIRNGRGLNTQYIPYKVHQGIEEVKEMLQNISPQYTLLVHASKNDTDQLQQKLMECGFKHIYSATLAEEISFK